MIFKTSKLNEFRLWGLLLTLLGMFLMILGTAGVLLWGNSGRIVMILFMLLGMISLFGSIVVYFWAGMLSTGATPVECPECGETTKMLGTTDRCMHCRTILTLDPSKATDSR